MVEIREFLSSNYPKSVPFAGVNAVSTLLTAKNYLVVADDENPCYGILTANDLLEHPHKLVIDCLTKKEGIQLGDSCETMCSKFKQASSEALPVYQDLEFLGVLEKTDMLLSCKQLLEEYPVRRQEFAALKTALLHNLYHEIRTPLNHVLGFMDVLSEMSLDENLQIEHYQQIIQNSSRQFLHFMNDLVDLSMVESGENLPLTTDLLYPESLLKELVAQYESDVNAAAKMSIHYASPTFQDPIVTDPMRLKQLVSRLLDMSIYYAPSFSSILVGCLPYNDGKHVRFFVKNETVQLDENQRKTILGGQQGFFQQDISERFGIGMDFVKTISALLHGTIEIEIDDQGYISAFVTLPFSTPPTNLVLPS